MTSWIATVTDQGLYPLCLSETLSVMTNQCLGFQNFFDSLHKQVRIFHVISGTARFYSDMAKCPKIVCVLKIFWSNTMRFVTRIFSKTLKHAPSFRHFLCADRQTDRQKVLIPFYNLHCIWELTFPVLDTCKTKFKEMIHNKLRCFIVFKLYNIL